MFLDPCSCWFAMCLVCVHSVGKISWMKIRSVTQFTQFMFSVDCSQCSSQITQPVTRCCLGCLHKTNSVFWKISWPGTPTQLHNLLEHWSWIISTGIGQVAKGRKQLCLASILKNALIRGHHPLWLGIIGVEVQLVLSMWHHDPCQSAPWTTRKPLGQSQTSQGIRGTSQRQQVTTSRNPSAETAPSSPPAQSHDFAGRYTPLPAYGAVTWGDPFMAATMAETLAYSLPLSFYFIQKLLKLC